MTRTSPPRLARSAALQSVLGRRADTGFVQFPQMTQPKPGERGLSQPPAALEPIRIVLAGPDHLGPATEIVDEYQESFDIVVRDSPHELTRYLAPPYGFWLVQQGAETLGCIALRPLPIAGEGEIKRLFLRPTARGQGLSDRLLDALESFAREQGYRRLLLDSKDDLVAALRFYRRRGYEPVERYNDNPQATVFLAVR